MDFYERHDVLLKLPNATVSVPFDGSLAQEGEPPFDLVEPRPVGGSEVQMVSGSFEQPLSHRLSLVGSVVVQDQMHIHVFGNIRLNLIEELHELGRAMAGKTLTQDIAGGDVQSGKQSGGSVAFVAMGHRAAAPLFHGESGLGSVQSLNLRFSSTHSTSALSGGER